MSGGSINRAKTLSRLRTAAAREKNLLKLAAIAAKILQLAKQKQPDLLPQLAQRIKRLRKSLKLSQSQFGSRLNCSGGSLPMGTWSAAAKFLLTSDGKDRGATSRLVFLEHRRNHNPRCTRHASLTSLRVVVPVRAPPMRGIQTDPLPVASLTIRAAAWLASSECFSLTCARNAL
jgi:DNA-binding transcriptional regulator YiaG